MDWINKSVCHSTSATYIVIAVQVAVLEADEVYQGDVGSCCARAGTSYGTAYCIILPCETMKYT